MNALTKSSPEAASWLSTGWSWRSESMVASFDALITRTPTPDSWSRACSIRTRSWRCPSMLVSALGSSSSASSMLPSCWWAESASRLSASIAATIWALLVSRLPVKVSIWLSTERTLSSRPVTALLSSWAIVFSWATPPPLRIRLSAPSTSSTSGLRPVLSSGMTSPSVRVPSAPVSGADSDTNFSPSRLVCRISAMVFSGSLVSLRSSRTTLAW